MLDRIPTPSSAMDTIPATVSIPGGSFLVGSEHGRPDESPVHPAKVRPFRLAVTPVTVRQYAAFLATGRAEAPPWWSDPDFAQPDQPVVGVTWFDAAAFAAWLTERTGSAWRLPSEAEWERAARGGLEQAATAWGASVPEGEIPSGPLRGPWPVGRGTPSAFGLLDMGTVVHEWCLDLYRPYETKTPAHQKPRPDDEPGSRAPERRASRGGSWRHQKRWSPPSARSSLPPSFRYADYGFRPVREM